MVERGTNRLRLEECIDNKRNEKELKRIITKHVKEGTTIMTGIISFFFYNYTIMVIIG